MLHHQHNQKSEDKKLFLLRRSSHIKWYFTQISLMLFIFFAICYVCLQTSSHSERLLIEFILYLALFVFGLSSIFWSSLCLYERYCDAHTLHIDNIEYSPKRAVSKILMPIVNASASYQVVKQLYINSLKQTGQIPSKILLLIWRISSLICHNIFALFLFIVIVDMLLFEGAMTFVICLTLGLIDSDQTLHEVWSLISRAITIEIILCMISAITWLMIMQSVQSAHKKIIESQENIYL